MTRPSTTFIITLLIAVLNVVCFGTLSRFENFLFRPHAVAVILGVVPLLVTFLLVGWNAHSSRARIFFLGVFIAGLFLAEVAGISLRPALLNPSGAVIHQYSLRAIYPLVGIAHLILLPVLLVFLGQFQKRRSMFRLALIAAFGLLYSLFFIGLLMSESETTGGVGYTILTACAALAYLSVWSILFLRRSDDRSRRITSVG